MKKHLLLRNGFVVSSILFATISAHTFSSQAPADRNGSPASNGTCANSGCHNGPAATDQTVTITTNIGSTGFQSNTDYIITVEGNRGTTSSSSSGFEASVETGNSFEGSIMATTSNVKTVGMGNYASHSGAQPFTGGVTTWSFTWNSGNAPDGATIYAAVNFANGNGNTNGDVIITESLQLMKAQNISITENAVAHLKVFPNPSTDELNITFSANGNSETNILLYDLQGRLVKTLVQGERAETFNHTFSISDVSPGLYVLNIQNESGVSQERIIVQ